MTKLKLIIFLLFCFCLPAAYMLGFFCGKSKAAIAEYQFIAKILPGNILEYDFSVIQNSQEIMKSSSSKIESTFYEMVRLHNLYNINDPEYLTCTSTRRIRKLIELRRIYVDWEPEKLGVIKSYLSNNCMGEPSHLNWATMERNPDFKKEADK